MQPCKTGDQPYSDASPYSECSLVQHMTTKLASDGKKAAAAYIKAVA